MTKYKKELLNIISSIYQNTPDFIKNIISYIGITGSFIFDLNLDDSDYDISIIIDPDVSDNFLINSIRRYFKYKIKERLPENVIDIHTISQDTILDPSLTIGIFCMKYQTENKIDHGVISDDKNLVDRTFEKYFTNYDYTQLFNMYSDTNKRYISRIYHNSLDRDIRNSMSILYHIFLMYNMIHYNNIFSEEFNKDKISRIKLLIKSHILLENEEKTRIFDGREPMEFEKQQEYYEELVDSIRTVYENYDLHEDDISIFSINTDYMDVVNQGEQYERN